jgi:hypothetical protein
MVPRRIARETSIDIEILTSCQPVPEESATAYALATVIQQSEFSIQHCKYQLQSRHRHIEVRAVRWPGEMPWNVRMWSVLRGQR